MSSLDIERDTKNPRVFDSEDYDDYSKQEFTEKSRPVQLSRLDEFAATYLKAEVRGIEQVPESERNDTSYINAGTFFTGVNMVVATFSTGILGITAFGLTFWDSVLTIIFFTLLGTLPVAFFSTFGPKLGLRQMVLSRFWFGYQGVRIIALINFFSTMCWSAINTMVAAQLLHSVGSHPIPPWAACLVLSLGSFLVSLMGYHFIHTFEKYTWIPNFIIFIIAAVRMAKSGAFTTGTMGVGASEAADILSFGGTVFGFCAGWVPVAADYCVYKPKNASRLKIFIYVFIGLAFPCIFVEIIGAACATGILTSQNFADHYNNNSVGGLLYAVLVENSLHGFGSFCQVLLALSTIANNVPSMYSIGFSAQTMWGGFRKVPRIVWSIISCTVGLALAIPAYYKFGQVFENFMNLISYWIALYIAISLSEHLFYRKSISNYEPSDYSDRSKLPVGFAAIFGLCCGAVGAAMGMSQVYYVGKIAIKIGEPPYGGDVGLELTFAFSFIGFNAVRWLELKYLRR
ncbi:Fcy2p [Sugiyamaella lignohabitans]|uniref:Fcy2p n=1 Tax=Sugiyamaella lignohabitans TaxID=796027 RepID=A0A167FZN6_9ASCO|nr:Fcy2p [Sugiyamaella lignohabitans]ANB15911.1 Fcy2p [Sugiyamaella lignohabitans]